MPQRTASVQLIFEGAIIEIIIPLSFIKKFTPFANELLENVSHRIQFNRSKPTTYLVTIIVPGFELSRIICSLRIFCEKNGIAFEDQRER